MLQLEKTDITDTFNNFSAPENLKEVEEVEEAEEEQGEKKERTAPRKSLVLKGFTFTVTCNLSQQ